MTDTTDTDAAFVVHFPSRGLSVPTRVNRDGRVTDVEVLAYGAELVVSPELLAASRNKYGESPFTMSVDDQVRRWGEVLIAPGPWPEGRGRLQPGSLAWLEQRERARQDIDRRPVADRPAAAAAVRAEYGQQEPTSRTTATFR